MALATKTAKAPAAQESKDAKGHKEKTEKASGNGGGLIIKLVVVFILLVFVIVAGFAVYIVVLPDEYPKPFYVSLVDSPPASVRANAAATPSHGTNTTSGKAVTPAAVKVAAPPAVPIPGEGMMYETGTKIVNLADPGGRRYLKISVVLEFAPHDPAFYSLTGEAKTAALAEFGKEMASKKPIIDDLLNTLLASKTFDKVYTVDGKDALRQEIVLRINTLLPQQKLMFVYFTEFVVQ
ncbi:MAG: flagellar basal body-associated FliL family protein [Chloroflexi bacterium]|nr:flagellar basal body-associated FliL family protein [Chloroflexota bacterium]MBI5715796.1 flagellar basal body-associated FliL family protein [Chloroflexota bacterium]